MTDKKTLAEDYTVKNALINYYLVLMFSVFPLFFTEQYANIRHDKFYLFVVLTGILLVCEIPIFIYSAIKDKSFIILSAADTAFLSLIIIFTVSTLCSDWIFDSFIGVSGRFCGLLTFIMLFLLYLVITRFFSYKEYVFIVCAAVMMIVYLLCILNSFMIDPLNIYAGYSDDIIKDFTSTIGNKNIMSSLCCVTAPMFFVLFINKKTTMRFYYLAAALIGVFAMVRCDSSSGYLGFSLTFAVLSLVYSWRCRKPYSKKLFFVLLSLYSLIALAAVSLFLYFTFFDTASELKGIFKFFRFNEKWGTHRGYMWIKSFEIFKSFDFKSILFGCGPDTFYNVFEPYFGELSSRFGDIANNSAHNELLNYLITTGVLGLAAYLTLIAATVIRAIKASLKNQLALVFVAPVLCYFFQSVVNVSTIIVLPVFFIFISLTEYISKSELNASR